MTTRYEAKSGSNHPDLDLLDTIFDQNEQVHTKRGPMTAKEAAHWTSTV